jgi:hypothetical protein
MGTTQRTKSNGFLALPAAQKSASSTGGGPSGEFGARNSPRAGPNHPRGVRTEYNRRLARRRPPGGAAPPTRVRGSGAGFGVQERVLNSTCGAMPRASGHLDHRAGERSFLQLPSGSCKSRRNESPSLFQNSWQFVQHLLATTHSTSSDLGMRCAPVMALGTGSEVGNLICRHRESGSRWLAYILTR